VLTSLLSWRPREEKSELVESNLAEFKTLPQTASIPRTEEYSSIHADLSRNPYILRS
jgi:hypothetical protein